MKAKLILLMGTILLWNCTDTLEENLNSEFKKIEIQINGGIEQQYHSRVNDGGFCGGDQIGLYGVNYTTDNTVAGTLLDKGNQVNNIRYTYDEENFKWTSSASAYYKDMNTHIDLYAYYPYGVPSSVTEYPFEVAKDQNNNNGYAVSDFLWAKTEKVEPSENKVKLLFSHRMSCMNVILTEGEGFEDGEFENLSKSVLVKNTIQTSTINLSNGVVTATGNASNEGIVMMDASDGFRAIVVPQTIKSETVLFAITVDGVSYLYKQPTAYTYEAGKQSKFTLEVKKSTITGTYEFKLTDTEIIDWIADIETHSGEARQYFVVNQETPGTLGALIKANGKNPDKIKNLKISGNVNAGDFQFMRDSMEILQAINLKECTITASTRVECYNNGYYYEFLDGACTNIDEIRTKLDEKYPNVHIGFTSAYVVYNANEIPANAFNDKSTLIYFSFPERVVGIGSQAFRNTLLSGALIIPNDVTYIDNYAFFNTSITSLTLPNKLKRIYNNAFTGCQALSGILNFPESLEILGDNSFASCSGLTGTLQIPSLIKIIPSSCFEYCKNLTGLILPEGLQEIQAEAFDGCSRMSGELILPQSIKEIGAMAFRQCAFQGELILPEQLKIIKNSAFVGNKFSNVIFPNEIIKIEAYAFSNNERICEPLVFPESLMEIGESAFNVCHMIPKVTFPSNLTTIQSRAFASCTGINAITSLSTTPPTIIGDAFDGIAKDNFTLEVPETSVVKYQTVNGWSEFRRISAHHDFAIARPLMRTLNAEYSKTYVLRAPNGLNWSIEEKPDWVTVIPSSGTGKTEVTITVDEMAATDEIFETESKNEYGNISYNSYEGRTGKIVFLLDDKDYRSTITVEQYDYEYGDEDVIVNQTATKGTGVNLVFMGDCFDARDIATGKYIDGINEAINHFFTIEPYKTYRDYFNVYTIVGMSPDSGMGTVNTIREAKFGSQYTIHVGVAPDAATTFQYACLAETVNESNLNESLVVMIENSQDYGGVTYMWSDGSAIAVCPMSDDAYPYDFRGLVQHEAGGHGFGKLGDEYIYHNAFIEACNCFCCPHVDEFNAAKSYGWYDNLSLSGDMNSVLWSHLIFHPKYSNVVDMYEGGFYHTRGVYRSEATSCMNNNIPYFSAISRQGIVKRIMDYAGENFSLTDFYAKDVMDAAGRSALQTWDKVATPNYAGASKQHAPKIMNGKPKIGK